MQANVFTERFSAVDDPRIDRSKRHELVDILFVCVAATIAGCDGPTEISEFVSQKLRWFRRFVRLENGVPSHQRLALVERLAQPNTFAGEFW